MTPKAEETMKMIATVRQTLFCIFVILFITGTISQAGKKPAPKTDTTSETVLQIKEKLSLEWPKEGKWASGYLNNNESGWMELFFPEGQSMSNWKEMATVEIVYKRVNANLAGMARSVFLGTRQGCPDAEWEIIKKNPKDAKHPYIIFEIRCNKFVNELQPAEVQLWKLIGGKTGLYNLQYSYRGETIPEKKREEIMKTLTGAHLKTDQK